LFVFLCRQSEDAADAEVGASAFVGPRPPGPAAGATGADVEAAVSGCN
jgi:hypothetical protein